MSADLPRVDRCDPLRKNVDFLMAALDASDTVIVPIWRGQAWVEAGRAGFATAREAGPWLDAGGELVFLGKVGGACCFAVDISSLDEPTLGGPRPVAMVDLRLAGSDLPDAELELLMYARGMIHWHQSHAHCAKCGSRTEPRDGGFRRECARCRTEHFPRTDPAIMLLVRREDRCLLARQPGFPKGMYSAIAGFVEPGESVEQAVRREAAEELGIEVQSLRYVDSQPWPFPASLMLGYVADAASDEFQVDGQELEAARWFTREELREPRGFFYPPRVSLAHRMIRRFVDAGEP